VTNLGLGIRIPPAPGGRLATVVSVIRRIKYFSMQVSGTFLHNQRSSHGSEP
jgi:hypothetical protein